MTPEQEAAYALGWGLPRDDLDPAVQLEYDRLRAEREARPQIPAAPPRTAERQPVRLGCLIILLAPVGLLALILGGEILAGFTGPKDITPATAMVTGTWTHAGGASVVLKADGTFTARHLPAGFGEWINGDTPTSGAGTWRVGRLDPSTEPGVILSFAGPGLDETELLIQRDIGSPLIMYYDRGDPDEGVSGQYQLVKQK